MFLTRHTEGINLTLFFIYLRKPFSTCLGSIEETKQDNDKKKKKFTALLAKNNLSSMSFMLAVEPAQGHCRDTRLRDMHLNARRSIEEVAFPVSGQQRVKTARCSFSNSQNGLTFSDFRRMGTKNIL